MAAEGGRRFFSLLAAVGSRGLLQNAFKQSQIDVFLSPKSVSKLPARSRVYTSGSNDSPKSVSKLAARSRVGGSRVGLTAQNYVTIFSLSGFSVPSTFKFYIGLLIPVPYLLHRQFDTDFGLPGGLRLAFIMKKILKSLPEGR